MSTSVLLTGALITPWVGTALIVLVGHFPNLRESVTLVCSVILFGFILALAMTVMSGGTASLDFFEIFPGVSISFSTEPLGILFALIASSLWILTSIYSIGYMRAHNERHQTRFYAFFAIALASVMGIAFADNMLTLFFAYELLTLSTYPLVTHTGDAQSVRAGRTYLGLLLGTSLGLQLLAILWTWQIAGTLDFQDGGILAGNVSDAMAGLLLVLYVLGIGKAALMPFHRWLPAAMVAPAPVSALLHAVAVVKAGVFTILKVVIYIFGLDFLTSIEMSQWLLYTATVSVLVASLIALRQDNLKARLAYSTISQLGYVVVGALLANAAGIIGGGLQIGMHAFGKITLFFCSGAILVASGKTQISQMRGLGRTMPITMTAFMIGALSVVGLPPMGGLWSKWYLGLGALEGGHIAILVVLLISSILNLAYLMPIPIRAFFGSGERAVNDEIREAPTACVIALSLSAFGCIALFFFPQPLFDLLRMIPLTAK
jgi:multicomponent Na+:H+ antiporter subunit D